MSEEKKIESLNDEALSSVAGGVTAELKAAYENKFEKNMKRW